MFFKLLSCVWFWARISHKHICINSEGLCRIRCCHNSAHSTSAGLPCWPQVAIRPTVPSVPTKSSCELFQLLGPVCVELYGKGPSKRLTELQFTLVSTIYIFFSKFALPLLSHSSHLATLLTTCPPNFKPFRSILYSHTQVV